MSLLSRVLVARIVPDSISCRNDRNCRIGDGKSSCDCCKNCDNASDDNDDVYDNNNYKNCSAHVCAQVVLQLRDIQSFTLAQG